MVYTGAVPLVCTNHGLVLAHDKYRLYIYRKIKPTGTDRASILTYTSLNIFFFKPRLNPIKQFELMKRVIAIRGPVKQFFLVQMLK